MAERVDRHVQEGEQAIWVWTPIITKQCPECENSPSYHENSDCEYDETPPEEWSKGLVGFKPTAVFDISQTEGEPLPELETETTGDAENIVPVLTEAADDLGITVRIIDADEWAHALPSGYELAPAVVVTQTLVELTGMVVLTRLVPAWLLPDAPAPIPAST